MAEDILFAEDPAVGWNDQDQLITLLIRKKLRLIGTLTALYMLSYVGLMVLAGFARPFMAEKLVGSVNIGFVLIAANYLLAWVLALIYVRAANSTFDPLVARMIDAVRRVP
jgi:uncharacterized membrane protein (DUF485 family)